MSQLYAFNDLDELWSAALGELEIVISKAHFSSWFKSTKLTDLDGSTATICVSSNFIKSLIEGKFHKEIIKTLRKLTDNIVVNVKYTVATSKPTINIPLPVQDTIQTISDDKTDAAHLKPGYTFDKFVVGANNRLAYTTAQAVAETPGRRHNPLFLYGGVGLGKTHLLHAIGNAIAAAQPNKKVVYTPCEDFANEYIDSLRRKNIDNFKKKYRGVDVFLVDDIQFLARKEGTQEEFFHTFNALHRKDAQIVMTADSLPRDIPHLEGRLSSRFGGGMVADIQIPNIETRVAILKEKVNQNNWDVEEEVIDYVAAAISSNVRELEGAFNRLMAQCQMLGNTPTVKLAQKILEEIAASVSASTFTPQQIIGIVCNHFNVDAKDLAGSRRFKNIVYPRQIAMYLLRSELNMSFPEIGKILGGKDHTTIMHGYTVMDSRNKRDEALHQEINALKEKIYSREN